MSFEEEHLNAVISGLRLELRRRNAEIESLKTSLAIKENDLKEITSKVIPGLITFGREGRLEEYVEALRERLEQM